MIQYRLKVSPEALASMDEQRCWYEQELPEGQILADKWLEKLTSNLARILEHPTRYGPAPENSLWNHQFIVRQMLFRPWKSGIGWRILFTADESSALITVLQVRHEKRPWLDTESLNDRD